MYKIKIPQSVDELNRIIDDEQTMSISYAELIHENIDHIAGFKSNLYAIQKDSLRKTLMKFDLNFGSLVHSAKVKLPKGAILGCISVGTNGRLYASATFMERFHETVSLLLLIDPLFFTVRCSSWVLFSGEVDDYEFFIQSTDSNQYAERMTPGDEDEPFIKYSDFEEPIDFNGYPPQNQIVRIMELPKKRLLNSKLVLCTLELYGLLIFLSTAKKVIWLGEHSWDDYTAVRTIRKPHTNEVYFLTNTQWSDSQILRKINLTC